MPLVLGLRGFLAAPCLCSCGRAAGVPGAFVWRGHGATDGQMPPEQPLSVLGWGLGVGRMRGPVLSGSLPPVGARGLTRPSCWFLDLRHVHWVTSQQGVLVARSQLPSVDQVGWGGRPGGGTEGQGRLQPTGVPGEPGDSPSPAQKVQVDGVRAVVAIWGPKKQGCEMGQLVRSQDPDAQRRGASGQREQHPGSRGGASSLQYWRDPAISRRAVCSCDLAALSSQGSRRQRRTRQPHGPSLRPYPITDPRHRGGAGGKSCKGLASSLQHQQEAREWSTLKGRESRGQVLVSGLGRPRVKPALPFPRPSSGRLCCSEPLLPYLQNGAAVLTRQGLWRLAADPGSKAPVCAKANRGAEVRRGGPGCDFFYLKTVPEVEKKKTFLRSTKPRVIKQNYVTGVLGILSV